MNVGDHVFASYTAHCYRSIVRQSGFRYAKSSRCRSRENAQLRPAIEECVEPAAVELHWKEQMVVARSTRGDRSIGPEPSRCRTRTGLPFVKGHAVTRQVEINVEAAQNVRTEDPVEWPEKSVRRIDRGDEKPSPWYCHAANAEAAQFDLVCLQGTAAKSAHRPLKFDARGPRADPLGSGGCQDS